MKIPMEKDCSTHLHALRGEVVEARQPRLFAPANLWSLRGRHRRPNAPCTELSPEGHNPEAEELQFRLRLLDKLKCRRGEEIVIVNRCPRTSECTPGKEFRIT